MPATRNATSAVPVMVTEVVDSALGREGRDDPVLPRTGGPAGNARLTAWLGLIMLVLIAAEMVTLLDVRGLITWHVLVGTLLLPPALAKTASTGWRIVRYYSGQSEYREAGPPPMILRLLGPLVVASTLALLGSGVALVLIGRASSHHRLVSVLGFGLDWVTIHQASFAVWVAVTGIHVLTRLVPALRLTLGGSSRATVPGNAVRVAALLLTAAVAVGAAGVLVHAEGSWSSPEHRDRERGAPPSSSTAP
jgi:hypothetical protein